MPTTRRPRWGGSIPVRVLRTARVPRAHEAREMRAVQKKETQMDFEPSSEQQMLIDQVRLYVREEIIPLEARLDPDASELAPEDHARLVEKTKAMGLFGIDIPKEFGGPDIDIVTRVLLAIEMAQHRAGLYVPCYGTF